MNSPSSHDHHHSAGAAPVEAADGRVTDPVCGMQVDPATTQHHATHADTPFHFCSERCRAKFVADPERYETASNAARWEDPAEAARAESGLRAAWGAHIAHHVIDFDADMAARHGRALALLDQIIDLQ